MTANRIEGICGVLAAVWGILVEAFLLFGPSYSTAQGSSDGTTSTGHTGLIGTGIGTATLVSLGLLTLTLLVIGLTAVLDSRSSSTSIFRIFLLIATGLLILYSCAAIASIGILLIPSLVLAIITAILSIRREGVPTKQLSGER